MREVIISEDKRTVPINKVDEDKIYAWSSSTGSILIMKKRFFGSNIYVATVVDAITKANGYDFCYEAKSLEEIIKIVIKDHGKVYEFDNFKEFCEWYLKEI